MPGGSNITGASNLSGTVNGSPAPDAGSGFGSQFSNGPGPGNPGSQPTGFAGANRTASSDNPNPTPDQDQNANPSSQAANPDQQPAKAGNPSDPLSARTFGGGPVVGVVSTSKKEGIREFNHKRKYNEWQFIFDPATGGGLLTMPNQPPPLQGFGTQQTQPGQTPQQGFGNSSPFGAQPGLGNGSTMTGPGAPTPPPTSNPPQQQ
jgi:hypothetical protein